MVPMVFDWANGDETCEIAKQNTADYVCTGSNTKCSNSTNGSGYRCECKEGFEGNPYLPGGCQDFNECHDDRKSNCLSKKNCSNIDGSYECFCPPGQYGNGMKEDEPCEQKKKKDILKWIIVGVRTGFVALFVCVSWIYLVVKQRNLIKLKEKFFRQNGGILLQQQLSRQEGSAENARIFAADELKKATQNYDESLIIGTGGYGTVYRISSR
ncbi:Wall-associated receptor kinase [Quillaja saponaria]|uniref:Wall-associated receptor kinase n=1 Tax=Quillaja saponaria TaxID=32244 RepID=A0AAD7LW66_QUISA|nr:Wall-associated receptor kinase [Quillaja saponaria]